MKPSAQPKDPELRRLAEDRARQKNWKRWGPYLSERQWSTVREDYSPTGECWEYFPHDHARSRAYRWGEDGLLGITDRECRLCFALALWNGRDPILKERLFGLTTREGNHGEDVKEEYFYLDSTPTHSYMRALYKYPQSPFPYDQLVEENARRSRHDPEFELADTGIFDQGHYFDVSVEYAKAAPDDILILITIENRSLQSALLHLLPTFWFRNTWSWGSIHEPPRKPAISRSGQRLHFSHATLGDFSAAIGPGPNQTPPEYLFTENESNALRHPDSAAGKGPFKDAFHDYLIGGRQEAVLQDAGGTKAAAHYRLTIGGQQSCQVRLRLFPSSGKSGGELGREFDRIVSKRKAEADQFYKRLSPEPLQEAERRVIRQGYAGLLWSKQFYHYVVHDWLAGDPALSSPPAGRWEGRNNEWTHLYSRDVISMPDKWEYPWFAAWDLAFHMIPLARIDGQFAKDQLSLFLREWYMHPNGQIPAYEFNFSDVNPPVHAWAAWRVYKISARAGARDRQFLESVFQKLLLNFTWWVNRKDAQGKNLFSGGFLGLDNIGVFDRSKPLPMGGSLQQADGTGWMAFYCATMLGIALELARDGSQIRTAYEDMASKFLEHFVQIIDAMNSLGGSGLWDENDGFYYDKIQSDGASITLRSRSLVGLLPLIAVEVLEEEKIRQLPGFRKRLEWFVGNRADIARHIARSDGMGCYRLLAIPSRQRLQRVLRYLLDENEFLSPFGIRSVSKYHLRHPYILNFGGEEHRVDYAPGDSDTPLFGGNSNWRGPVWFPVNYLIIEALERYHHFYGEEFKTECPVGSGIHLTLREVASMLSGRLARIFLPDAGGRCPCHGGDERFARDPAYRDLLWFYECFHGDTGRGIGASHQTGWTSLAVRCVEDLARSRNDVGAKKSRARRWQGRNTTAK